MKLSTLSILLGLVMAVPNILGVLKPAALGAAARKFPRHPIIGPPLMLAATVWFLYYVSQEAVSDFLSFKPGLYALFGAVGVGACIFVRDFLPVRGLAVLFLLLAKLIVDTARWVDTEWRLVVVTWAYVLILAGMWFTISPWRLRDLINWATANEQRTRMLSVLRLAFALVILVLGLTVYRSAEAKTPSGETSPQAVLTAPSAN
jgi:hypothetical protein